ncbi:MAG TPA: glycosyltransferase family 39 protein [Thermoanaerobaculia bacterium]|nr:glycosyltransferase family 39 protein [Thermoanaerobaculia bacterium]
MDRVAPTPAARHPWVRDLLLLTLGVALLYGPHLGRRALWSPDEGRYAEIPREMVASGDWVTPRLNGVKYFEKPPLVYWLTAGAIELGGTREGVLRLVPALFALLSVLGVYAAGRCLYGRPAGLWAGGILATTPLWFGLGESLTLDMGVSSLLTLALLAFLFAARAERPGRRRLLLYLFYALAALATLTKGLIGIFIPGMVLGAWILLTRQWRLIRLVLSPVGIGLFLLIAVPWHVLVARAHPEFTWFYFVHEHFLRYTTKVHKRYEPIWFFLPILVAGMLPWTAFLPRALRTALRAPADERQANILFLLWAALVFAFFSLSDSKLVPYILPVLPPLSLLLGRDLAASWETGARKRGAAYVALLVLAWALGIAFLFVPQIPKAAASAELLGGFTYALAGSLLLMGLLPLALDRTSRARAALLAAAASAFLFLTVLGAGMPRLDSERSVRSLAREIRARWQPGDEVASLRDYFQDLPFYLGRTVTVAAWRGELDYGIEHEDVRRFMIGEDELWRRWNGPGRVYLVVDAKTALPADPTLKIAPQLLARSGNVLLYVNHL